MTDFATEILPEEEEKAEELLPRQEDAQEARAALEVPKGPKDRPRPELSSAGNAALARELGNPREGTEKIEPQPPAEEQPVLTPASDHPAPDHPVPDHPAPDRPGPEMAAEPAPPSEEAPESVPVLETAAPPKADPAAERRDRLKLLTRTLSRLLKSPEDAPVEALFTAYREAPLAEQADAALAIANAVLRVDADRRRRARVVLATATSVHKAHPLAQMLAMRLGAWVSTHPAPPPPPEPDGDP